ncbi:MAG: hypothetical protein JWM74_60 [Myxococcaceae bacterium]|nr:hypothetical protein [Myxococcaceae bacterium]
MSSQNDTEPLAPPSASGDTDPAYPPATGDRPSYGSLGQKGVKAHVGKTDPGPGEPSARPAATPGPSSASGIPALAIARGPDITPTPALLLSSPAAGSRRNDSIDELIEGLPEEALLPKKRTRATSGQDAARWDAQGRPFPGVTGDGPDLPAVIVRTDTTSPPLRRKMKMDAPTFVTPQGHDLQVQRKIALGVAVVAIVAIVVIALKWSSTSDLPVKPGVANTSPTETMTSKSLGMPIATTTPTTTEAPVATTPPVTTAASTATAPRSTASSPRVAPKGSDSRIEHDYRLDR